MNDTTSSSPVLVRWLKLGFGLGVLLAWIYVIGPATLRIDSVRIMANTVEEQGIESGALYWSDVTAVGTAEEMIRATIKYPPKGP
jgi:hypothetical protein